MIPFRPRRTQVFYGPYEFGLVGTAPTFNWATSVVRDGKLDQLFQQNTLDFNGTMLRAGLPSGDLASFVQDINGLQTALTTPNQEFRILYDGNPIVSGIYPRINNVVIDEGTWADRVEYSFELEYDESFSASGQVQSFSETWGFNEAEDRRSALVQHDISAVGLNTGGSGINNALSNAITFVNSKTGYQNAVVGTPAFVQVSGVTFDAYEELRSEQVDTQSASYSVSETFTLSSGNYVRTGTAQLSQADDGINTLTIDGNIRGLGRGEVCYDRALAAWSGVVRPSLPAEASGIYQALGGRATIFTNDFDSLSVTENRSLGTIDFSASYTDSPSDNLPSGVTDFSINVQDNQPVGVFASFGIPERVEGNIVQNIGTTTEGSFAVQGSATGKSDFPFVQLLAYVEDRVNAIRPIASNYTTLRQTSKSINKDELNNVVSFNISWTYTKELTSIDAFDGDVTIE